MFRRFSTIAIAAAMLLTASCARENLVGNGLGNDGMLKFSLSMSGSPSSVLETKSASISTEDGTVSLPLCYERRDGIESRMPAAVPVTKGTQYNSAEQYEGSDSPAFSVVAWNSDGTPFIEDATEVTFTSNKWTPASSYKWEPEKDVKTFLVWANAPASGAGVSNALIEGVATQTFTYTVPTDARQQNDVMLGWYKGDGGETMTAAITMVHPLTAIVFKKGEMDEYITGIKKINISGLCKTGSVDVTYSSSGVPSYVWTMGSQNQSVSLTPLGVEETIEVDGTTSVIGVPFIVLPQTVSASQVKISVVVTRNGNEETLYAYLPAGSLVEGQTNVFTIGHDVYLPEAMPAEFSVSPTKKVYFSRGNLYCTRSGQEGNYTYSFAFEKHQYNFRTRPDMMQFSDDYVTPIDFNTPANTSGLFEWDVTAKGSDFGAFGVAPITTGSSSDVLDFGEAVGANWTTLSAEEWAYLIDTSRGDSRYAKAVVNGVNGLLLFPDGWTNTYNLQGINDSEAAYTTNILALTGTPSWQNVENQGVIFLPAAGCMANNSIHGEAYVGAITTVCDYWSSTAADYVTPVAQYLTATYYADNSVTAAVSMSAHNRDYARAVRLVTTVLPEKQKVEFIDLGLPSGTLWANMNIGAKSETEIGDYFAWGETEARGADWATSKPYTWANAPFNNGSSSYNSTYFTANKSNWLDGNTLKPEYDAAHVAYGGDATMPTSVQIQELIDNTDISCIENTGLGYYLWKLTNKRDESKFIYLPCGGWRDGSTIEGGGAYAQIWSSTLYNSDFGNANDIRLQGSTRTVSDMGRCIGMPVRAVKSPAPKPDVLPGEFSVSATKKVKFSKGNLWADKSSGQAVWHFEDNQYDYRSIGEVSEYDKPAVIHGIRTITPSGYWGLFGFSSTNVNAPYGISTDYETNDNYLGDFVEWGTALDGIDTWRTLSGGPTGEWHYILCERQTEVQGIASENPRFFFGSVHNGVTTVNGIYVFPDKFSWPDGLNKPQNINVVGDFSTNDYSSSVFNTLENAGMVFLPAVGARNGFAVFENEKRCQYWSSTPSSNTEKAFELLGVWLPGNYTIFDASGENERHGGYSVRLVTDFQSSASTIEVTGEVCTNYNVTNGPKEYKVKSGSPWKLQYTLDDGANWLDAKAGQTIDGWISFDKVSGIASDQEVSVKATVAPATSQTTVTVNHNDNLRKASYRGQNSDIASQQRPYDLSMHDIYGNPTQRNTANCYVISGPGLYAFPLVYGNAIKNGADNVQAYKPNVSGTNVLSTFQSATGDINSTDITGVTSAAPLWEDVADWALVGENDCKVLSPSQAAARGLTAGCGYVMFEVKADNLTPGNAVIAVRNSGGTILWSWHLWVTDLDLNTVAVTNSSSQTLDLMPYNLGWVDTENTTTNVYEGKSLQIRFYSDATTSVTKMASRTAFEKTAHIAGQSPTYQWGRKDPFIRAKSMSDNTELGAKEYSGTIWSLASGSVSSVESVKYPTVFADLRWSKSDGGGGGGMPNNLWSAQNMTYGTESAGYDSAPVKTVYDPSPAGFQVPQANAFSHFSFNTDDTPFGTIKGYNFYTKPNKTGELLFFPATGYRAGDTGSVNNGVHGIYWSAAPSTAEYGYGLYFLNGTVYPVYSDLWRSTGLPVRPVKE